MILLKTTQETTSKIISDQTLSFTKSHIWFWIAIAELIIILYALYRIKKKNSNLSFSDLGKDAIKESATSKINMEDLMESINNSKELYKELSRKCHPDRFINMPEQKFADNLFQEITLHKRNYQKLLDLKKRAIEELKIN